MENTGVDEPARADLQAVSFREVEDAIVALVPALQTLADLRFCGAGLQSHESVGETIADVVLLRREIVRLGLALLPDQSGLSGILVHVVRDRAHVVEELRVNRPLRVFGPEGLADECAATFGNGLQQGKAVLADDDIA